MKHNVTVQYYVTITLNESEMRALDALVGYGTPSFLKVFYEKMGRAYLEKHESGLVSLFQRVRDEIPHKLRQIDLIKKTASVVNGNAKYQHKLPGV